MRRTERLLVRCVERACLNGAWLPLPSLRSPEELQRCLADVGDGLMLADGRRASGWRVTRAATTTPDADGSRPVGWAVLCPVHAHLADARAPAVNT